MRCTFYSTLVIAALFADKAFALDTLSTDIFDGEEENEMQLYQFSSNDYDNDEDYLA